MKSSDLSVISDVFQVLDVEEGEVSHMFLNEEYSGLNRKISDGDGLAIFPKKIGLLYE